MSITLTQVTTPAASAALTATEQLAEYRTLLVAAKARYTKLQSTPEVEFEGNSDMARQRFKWDTLKSAQESIDWLEQKIAEYYTKANNTGSGRTVLAVFRRPV